MSALKLSPSGSICPYYYMGGELQPLKYGSYFSDKVRLFQVMKAEEEFIMHSSGQHNRRVWIDLYETKLDGEVIDALACHIKTIEPKILRLCLVGCPLLTRNKVKKKLVEKQSSLTRQIRFFSDPEKAKQWLVGERP